MSSLAAQLLAISVAVLQRQMIHNNAVSRTTWNRSYDYVIVGGGTAGCTLAGRLSQDGQSTVLLLEAGGHGSVVSDMPANTLIQVDPRENDWGYRTTPQRNAALFLADHRVRYPRGRVLGGSSVLNFMVYNRGNRRDFDNWAQNYSLPDWSYDNILPYFRRAEHLYNTSLFSQTIQFRGLNGPIATSLPANPDPIHERYIQGWENVGYPKIDVNGYTQNGVSYVQQTIDPNTWTRASSAYGYIYPNINRTNLHIVAKARVLRVLIRNNAAYAVEFQREGRTYTVETSREIIVSAGGINTVQVLQLSGIGPREELQRLNVPLIADLPVGRYFQDHFLSPIIFRASNASDLNWSRYMYSRLTVSNLYDYYIHRTGPLSMFALSASSYSSSVNDVAQWPDCVTAMLGVQIGQPIMDALDQTSDPAAWRDYLEPLNGDQSVFAVIAGIYRVHSRGTVTLASNDPFEAPLIDPNYLADPRDMTAAVEIIQRVLEMADTPYFRSIATWYDKSVPGCESTRCPEGQLLRTCHQYIQCVVRQLGWTSWHPVGTARMGTNSSNSVIDARLRVHGIRNLRVADASIMPQITNGNTNAPTFMIGEKASDIILQDRR